ncbi:MAG: helix-turn-helix domain-containing protein [Bifidobacteriaceae bacterium]|jgi:transcriptional regulator with XRE-family HTH domain|nr:helix-turn-helix domain-containing protein [Bifidobacteriaceae bacterium]
MGGVPVGFEAGGMTTVGWMLRAARTRAGLTLADAARLTGADSGTYAAVEAGGGTLGDEAYGEAFAALMGLPEARGKRAPRRWGNPSSSAPPRALHHGRGNSLGLH